MTVDEWFRSPDLYDSCAVKNKYSKQHYVKQKVRPYRNKEGNIQKKDIL